MNQNASDLCYPALRRDFKDYLSRFRDEKGLFSAPLKLKIAHTHRVVREMKVLAENHNSSLISVDTSLCAALLHDIGRFQQFVSFGTYDDRVSINHAALSVVVIDQLGLLARHNDDDRELIRTAVRLHNSETIPQTLSIEELNFVRMLRDADKLDIWRVVLEQDNDNPIEENYSKDVLDRVTRFEHVPYASARTKADMRLFRLSWVFDTFFPTTLRAVISRGYLERMFSKLPQSQQFMELKAAVKDHILKRSALLVE